MDISIIELTRKNIEESNIILQEKNNNYYLDVLDFLNLLFEQKSKNIIGIRIKKITLNSSVFELYNKINEVYKLGKPIFDIDGFDNLEIEDPNEIKNALYEIACKLSNYLLEKLNYRLKITHTNNKARFIIESI
jgi:hypothetical protein